MESSRWCCLGPLVAGAIAAFGAPNAGEGGCRAGAPSTVTVIVDLDAASPGIQSTIHVPAGTTRVPEVAVHVFDHSGQSCIFGIGYLGGIDRGIALGHMPSGDNSGTVSGLEARLGPPINPGNVNAIAAAPGLDPGFAGPEIQYIEGGAEAPAVIPGFPGVPVVVVDVLLEGAAPGDVFDLYLLDFVTVWTGGAGGAFSTQGHLTLDSGGDSVPDATQSIHGVDPDAPIPVPPASFLVDYVDGGDAGGPATIRIVTPGDLDGDGDVDASDLLALLAAWGPCPAGLPACSADLDGDGIVGVPDLLILLSRWG